MDYTMTNTYTGLHQHSVYSVLDGFAKVEDMVVRAKELGMHGVCISDHGTMAACYELNKQCKKHDIKPIFANEMYVAPGSNLVKERLEGFKPSYHLIVIAKNNEGYKNLMRLTSDSWINGKYYKPRTSIPKLSEHREGIIILAACIGGFPQQLFLEGREEEAEDHLLEMQSIFGEDYYLEVQYSGLREQELVNDFFLAMSNKHGFKTIITADSHYVNKEDSQYHNALVNIHIGGKIKKKADEHSLVGEEEDQDDSGMYYTPHEYYIKSCDDFIDSGKFTNFLEGFGFSNAIADECNVEFVTGQKYIPAVPGVDDEDNELAKICEKGLGDFFDRQGRENFSDKKMKEYWDRLYYELGIIKKMEFSRYFLVVSEYVQWSKDNGIMVGGGRGSGAGSLVAYTSRITDVDPIRYGLLFERFLSRGRAKRPLVEFEDYTYEEYLKDKENV